MNQWHLAEAIQPARKNHMPLVMGILNVTPDSFSDGGQFNHLENARIQAEKMLEHGVDIIDIGGESTRPGAAEVSVQEELDRVLPIIELAKILGKPISIDTSKAEVMQAAVQAGASLINDVCALTLNNSLSVAAKLKVPVCLMHMQGSPRTMQKNPHYDDVVTDVLHYLQQRVKACEQAGILKDNIIVDPGFGFGKTLEHNLKLLADFKKLTELGCATLLGVSRKSMFQHLLGREVEERLSGSLSAALLAVDRGADIIRVHDVKQTVDALKVRAAVLSHC